ncbi:hypothetical protein ACQCVE_00240 [Metabacillus sp. 113a]|uniref:hypothetical protein n=1 Tax=Metabacillus sp. 113a TaxID=3404706 RepID=UPI003CEB45F7
MPNCDWGRPCNCLDCRTNRFSIHCEACGFDTMVSYVMSEVGGHTDKKGMFSYEFKEQTEKYSEINCFKCGEYKNNVPYFEKIEVDINNSRLNQRTCVACGVKELETFRKIKYKVWKNETFCTGCVEKQFMSEVPNPSTNEKVFKVDTSNMKYILEKVKIPCNTCGRQRWLNVENQWKKQCTSCYKKALKR